MNLSDKNISYMVMSSEKVDDIISVLWAKSYQVIPIQGYYKGVYEDAFIAYSTTIDNDELKEEVKFLLKHFKRDNAIVKYRGETSIRKIFNDGYDFPMKVVMYPDIEKKSYIYEGISFAFVNQQRYKSVKSKSDLKVGMIVEYYNKGKWYKQEVKNPSEEYDRFYKLFIKYDKVRVAI